MQVKMRTILCAALGVAGTLGAAGFTVSGGAKAEARPDGTIRVTYPPGQGGPQVRIPISARKWGKGTVHMTIRQVEPRGKLRTGITVGAVPMHRGMLEAGYIHNELKAGETVEFDFRQKGVRAPNAIYIAAKSPSEPVILEIGGFSVLSTANMAKKVRLAPIPAIRFKGKPFFPVGIWDVHPWDKRWSDGVIDSGFLEAEGDFTILGSEVAALSSQNCKWCNIYGQPRLFPALDRLKNNSDYENVALAVGLSIRYLLFDSLREKDILAPLTGETLEKRRQTLAEAAKKLSAYPNVIGCTIDDPENAVCPYYHKHHAGDWEKTGDLAAKLIEWIGWRKNVIRTNHPGALFMPVIAWWTTYSYTAPLYDVCIVNEYPRARKEEFAAPLYTVFLDAARQAEAVRKNGGRRSAVFMPPMYDQLSGIKRPLNLREQRYVNFVPITRGVMGICGWRLQRCSSDYRKSVIFPAMQEVSRLTEFFLGEWGDELVSSDHDEAAADCLKKFKVRVRRVAGMEDAETLKVKDGTPDVTCCLRKHSGGRCLLLAGNNRREPLTVHFRLDLPDLPGAVTEVMDGGRRVRVNPAQRTFRDKFAPFAVHACIFKPVKRQPLSTS